MAALCFSERSVPYHSFFVLHPSRFLSYTHQVFFLCPAPIKISALHLSRFLCPATAPYQGFSRAYQGRLRAPTKEMSFVSLFTSLCGSSVKILYFDIGIKFAVQKSNITAVFREIVYLVKIFTFNVNCCSF